MTTIMKLYLLYSIVLVCCSLQSVHGEPEPEPEPKPNSVIQLGNGRRSSFFNAPASIKSRSANMDQDVQIVDDIEDDEDDDTFVAGNDNKATTNKDASSGRLFLRRFLLFKNIFNGGNRQPVIPIIITGAGAGSGTGTANPTTTTTTSGTIPAATGTITTSPIPAPGAGGGTGGAGTGGAGTGGAGTGGAGTGGAGTGGAGTGGAGTGGAGAGGGLNRITFRTSNPQEDEEDDQMANDEDEAEPSYGGVANEQTLQAALAAGAQEYIVTDADVQGSGNAGKANRQPSRINLRRKGTRRGQGQVISVRIPPRYRRYFKNGQKVMLNTQGNNKRRVIRKRVQNKRRPQGNRNKKNKNKNKRQRIIAV